MDTAGVAHRQLKDTNIAFCINDFVQKHGGIQEVNKQLENHRDGILSVIKEAGIGPGLAQRSGSLLSSRTPVPRPRKSELGGTLIL